MIENEFLPAELHDLKNINDLITKHNSVDDRSYKPSHLDTEDVIESDRSIVFLSKKKDLLNGYLRLYGSQPFNSENCEAKIIIAIEPTFRKRGIGKSFIKFLIEYAEKNTSINKLIAEVRYDNMASKKLFEKHQFIVEHENGFGCTMVLKLKR
jgi:RimJ/RimL family protein N-acetyltransferase